MKKIKKGLKMFCVLIYLWDQMIQVSLNNLLLAYLTSNFIISFSCFFDQIVMLPL